MSWKTNQPQKGMKDLFSGTSSQVLAVLSCTVSAISDGMTYGWTSPVIPILQGRNAPVKMTENEINWLENIYLLGAIFGIPCTIFLVEKIGRKYSVLTAGTINLAAWILIAFGTTPEILLAARFMTGVAGDVAFVAAPMYIAEIADQKIRGFLATIIYIMLLVGIFIIYVVGPYVSIFISSSIAAVFLVIQLATFPFMPESPYFNLSKGKFEEAKHSLKRLRNNSDIDGEIADMRAAIERQKSERGRPLDLILEKSNRKALLIMVVLNAAQHMTGVSVLLMNLHVILTATESVYIETNKAAIIFSALMMPAAIVAGLVCDKLGRKFLLIASSFCTTVILLTISIFFHLKHLGYSVAGVSWLPIICIFLYALVFKVGLGIIPIVLTAELFPVKVKAIGMSTADAVYLFWAFVSVYIFLESSRTYGMHIPFYIFTICALFTTIFCIFWVPETRGKTLEEIQMMLKGIDTTRKDVELVEIKKRDNSAEYNQESEAFLVKS